MIEQLMGLRVLIAAADRAPGSCPLLDEPRYWGAGALNNEQRQEEERTEDVGVLPDEPQHAGEWAREVAEHARREERAEGEGAPPGDVRAGPERGVAHGCALAKCRRPGREREAVGVDAVERGQEPVEGGADP